MRRPEVFRGCKLSLSAGVREQGPDREPIRRRVGLKLRTSACCSLNTFAGLLLFLSQYNLPYCEQDARVT